MKKIIASIILMLIVTLPLTAQVKQPYIIAGAEAYTINSKINQKVYNLAVSLPHNYDKAKKYPTYYILDGFYAFPIIAESHKMMGGWKSSNQIEDVIIVSITGNETNGYEWLCQRWPDYTFTQSIQWDTAGTKDWFSPTPLISGKGDAFLEVIRNEIIPLIEKNYNTNQERGISGHSLSGLYVANLLFKANDIFSKFGISSSGALHYNNNDIRLIEKEYSNTHDSLKAKVFLSYASLEEKEEITDLYEFEALLKKYNGVETKLVIYDDETHVSMIPAMISKCLRYLYTNEKVQ